MPGPPKSTVWPRVPEIRFVTPTSGGSAPDTRFTLHVPSRSLIERDGYPLPVSFHLVAAAPREPDRPVELGLEVADLHDVEHRPAAFRPQAPRPGVARHDLVALEIRSRGRRERHDEHRQPAHGHFGPGAGLRDLVRRAEARLDVLRCGPELENDVRRGCVDVAEERGLRNALLLRAAAAGEEQADCHGEGDPPHRGRLAHVADAPGKDVPFPPMEAELVSELPTKGGWRYEPKWDGFRGVMENDNGELALWSRNGRPLLRYFPELRAIGDTLPPHSALDGEIVIAREGKLDFDAMQTRLHPAESRVRKLSGEIPAMFVAFDLLLWKGKPVWEQPIEKRRHELERVANGIALSPVTEDVEEARSWLQTLQAAGFDGVIAKRLGLPYLPGSRDGVVKVKPHRTADAVVIGVRWKAGGRDKIATLLLGLYRDDGELDYVGSAAVGAKRDGELAARGTT